MKFKRLLFELVSTSSLTTFPLLLFFIAFSKYLTRSAASSSISISLSLIILNCKLASILWSGNISLANLQITSSTFTNSFIFSELFNDINFGSALGITIIAFSSLFFLILLILNKIAWPLFGIKGKGCDGSMAVGVIIG